MSEEENKRGEWDFDIILVGTSPKECFLSGLLAAVDKKRILHLDRNNYYGGECVSFNLKQLYDAHRGEDAKINPRLLNGARVNDYAIDVTPKLLLGDGVLVKCLRKMIPEDYMKYGYIAGSYVFHDNALHKVPTTPTEGLQSKLLGMMQTIRFRSFINFVDGYRQNDNKTWEGHNLETKTMRQIYSYYKIDQTVQTFVSHALALQTNDAHLDEPALPIIQKIKLYAYSLQRFPGATSPYIYPYYGLGNISESYSRLASIYGSTYITDCKIKSLNYDADGKFTGLTFNQAQLRDEANPEGEITATAAQIIGDPSYFTAETGAPDYTKKVAQITRSVCILNAPIKNASEDCQIILPGKSTGRTSDIYVSCLSAAQRVCPQGVYLAVLSSTNNGADADINDKKAASAACSREMKAAYSLLGNSVIERFDWVSEQRVASNDTSAKGIFISESFDATTHFQTVMSEVFQIYKNVTGKDFNPQELKSTREMQEEEMAKAQAAMDAAIKREAEEKAAQEAAAPAATEEAPAAE